MRQKLKQTMALYISANFIFSPLYGVELKVHIQNQRVKAPQIKRLEIDVNRNRVNTHIVKSKNGVDIVNIGRVNSRGVSHNSFRNYNEPQMMKKDLIKKGVPSKKIFLDYAGFRTYDSVIRAKKVFGLKSMTIISQRFHLERAIFIAKKKGINAVGFAAKNVKTKKRQHIYYIFIREKLARVKMILDLMFGKTPKFLGKKISIMDN